MPKPFLDCVKKGGKISTRKIPDNKYQRLCTLGKKTYAGEIKRKLGTKKKKK